MVIALSKVLAMSTGLSLCLLHTLVSKIVMNGDMELDENAGGLSE